MGSIAKVVPVISDYLFRPDVEAACKAASVRCTKTNGLLEGGVLMMSRSVLSKD